MVGRIYDYYSGEWMSRCNLYRKGRIICRFVDCGSSTNAGTSSGDLTGAGGVGLVNKERKVLTVEQKM